MSADLVGMGGQGGTLEAGTIADLILLDRDPVAAQTAPGNVSAAVAKATMVGRRWVHGA